VDGTARASPGASQPEPAHAPLAAKASATAHKPPAPRAERTVVTPLHGKHVA